MTNVIRQMQRQQAERRQAITCRLFGGFQPDPAADAVLAAIEADATFKQRLTPFTLDRLDAYAKDKAAHDAAQKGGAA